MKWWYREVVKIVCKIFRPPQVRGKEKNVSNQGFDLPLTYKTKTKQICYLLGFPVSAET